MSVFHPIMSDRMGRSRIALNDYIQTTKRNEVIDLNVNLMHNYNTCTTLIFITFLCLIALINLFLTVFKNLYQNDIKVFVIERYKI
jgi:hypothetical protein